jgi:hypothetical protein
MISSSRLDIKLIGTRNFKNVRGMGIKGLRGSFLNFSSRVSSDFTGRIIVSWADWSFGGAL